MSTKTNGAPIAPKAVNDKPELSTASVVAIPKKEDQKKETVKDDQPPINDRLEKLNHLFSLVDQRDKLVDTLDDLKKFDTSSDNTKDRLTLDDGKGHTFQTYQPDVIKEVVALVRQRASERLKKVESMIAF